MKDTAGAQVGGEVAQDENTFCLRTLDGDCQFYSVCKISLTTRNADMIYHFWPL